ncbi:hypothetical protein Pfo_018969 [Paulownia fortunei]|nr:hypothetical protein Pfo_018969 [Paulownia fortunei]
MGLWSLLEVSSMPILQVLIISVLGVFMATDYLKLLPPDARKSLNKVTYFYLTAYHQCKVHVFNIYIYIYIYIFNFLDSDPAVNYYLAKTVRLEDIISWYDLRLHNLMTAHLDGNLGNILLIIIPAICKEDGNPFGDKTVCSTVGLSYVSFSMALGSFYIWTYTHHLIRTAGEEPNKDLEIVDELKAPPVLAAVIGFISGAVSWLRNLIIGDSAPFRVIDDSIKLLGDGTIPCIILILGGNLTQGTAKQCKIGINNGTCSDLCEIHNTSCNRDWCSKSSFTFRVYSSDPLYHFVLMIQFTLPPAISIELKPSLLYVGFVFSPTFLMKISSLNENVGTMTQLFDVAQEECSVLFLWTYLVAALSLTGWSTVFMWILS